MRTPDFVTRNMCSLEKGRPLMKTSLLGAAAAFCAAGAHAQSVDYGLMTEMFGEPVTLGATGTPQRVSDVPVNMEIITAEEIRASAASSLPDILRRVAGVTVRELAAGQTEVGLRGYTGPLSERLLVLVNGREVYLSFFGMVTWDAIPVQLSEIQQIEIVRGPNTALYGFNAVSGVINIITRDPARAPHVEAVARGGSQNFINSTVSTGVKLNERLALRLSAGLRERDEHDTAPLNPLEAPFERSRVRAETAAAELIFSLNAAARIGLEATLSSTEANYMVLPRFAGPNEHNFASYRAYADIDSRYGITRGQVYFNDFRSRWSPVTPFGQGDWNTGTDLLVVSGEHTVRVGSDHVFRVNAEYRSDEFTGVTSEPGTYEQDIFSIGGLWNWSPAEKLELSTALRYDRVEYARSGPILPTNIFTNADYDNEIAELSVNFGALYRLSAQDQLRFVYARGVDAPAPTESGAEWPFVPDASIIALSEPQLEPTIVTHVEANWDRTLPSINADLRLAVFWQNSQDMQAFAAANRMQIDPDPFRLIQFFDNIGDTSVYGAELSLKGAHGDHVDWRLSYSYADVQDDLTINPDGLLLAAIDFEAENIEHTAVAQLGIERGRWRGDLLARYTSAHEFIRDIGGGVLDRVDVDANVLVNTKLAYELSERAELSLVAQGLADDEYLEAAFRPIERRYWVELRARF